MSSICFDRHLASSMVSDLVSMERMPWISRHRSGRFARDSRVTMVWATRASFSHGFCLIVLKVRPYLGQVSRKMPGSMD